MHEGKVESEGSWMPGDRRKRWIRISLLALAAAAAGLWLWTGRPAEDFAPPTLHPSFPHDLTVLTANVGNSNLFCRRYLWKLCWDEVEARIATNIQALKPDIVALQELMPGWLCADNPSSDRGQVCFEGKLPRPESQVRRLLGPDYTIVCDPQYGFECIGVATRIGTVRGCPQGEECPGQSVVETSETCDPGFGALRTAVDAQGRELAVINAHLENHSAECRASALLQIFGQATVSASGSGDGPTLLLGDFNLDPWRMKDPSIGAWNTYVGGENRFGYLSGGPEEGPPLPTFRLLTKRYTLDHVLSDSMQGVCVVLGESAGTSRLDGGWGTDHRAVFCELAFPETPSP